MNKSKGHIKWENNHPGNDTLRLYAFNQLSKDELREVELHLLECELCSDMVEGYALLENEKNLKVDLQTITTRFENKGGNKTPVFYLRPYFYYAIAASLVLMLGFAFFLKNGTGPQKEDNLVELNPPEEVKESESKSESVKIDSIENTLVTTSTLNKNTGKQIALKKVDEKSRLEDQSVSAIDAEQKISEFISATGEVGVNKNDVPKESKAEEDLPDLAIGGDAMQADGRKNDDVNNVTSTAPASIVVTDELVDFSTATKEETKKREKLSAPQSRSIGDDKDVALSDTYYSEGDNLKKSAPARTTMKSGGDTKAKKQNSNSVLFEQGLVLYRNEKYNLAKEKFSTSVKNEGNADAEIFKSFVDLINKADNGNLSFVKSYIETSGNSYKEDAEWALAIYYLQQSNRTEAEKYLLKLKNSKGPYSKMAENKLIK